MNERMDRSKLQIGTYFLQEYARTEQHVKDLKDCGIDFVFSMDDSDRATLDLFAKYGVGAVVNDIFPGWWGGDGDNAGKMHAANPLERYREGAARFVDHPAIWGVDIGDEPSALDFPYYGEVVNAAAPLVPRQFLYLNLYPNYASIAQNNAAETVNQLGTATYAEHIEQYCKYVPLDYLSYDFYLYSISVAKHYENLRVVADACRKTGRQLWIILQVNSNRPAEWITENGLRFQAYTSMAFGAEVISWACYTAGWWHNQVLDDKGEKTQQYDKLKRVNRELHALGPVYMAYRNTATHFVGMDGTEWMNDERRHDEVRQTSEDCVTNAFFRDLKADNGAALVVGDMVKRSGRGYAEFVACADDPYDKINASYNITFSCGADVVRAWNGDGEVPVTKTGDGQYSVPVVSSGCVMITAE